MARYLYYQGGYQSTDAIGSTGPYGPGGPAGTFFSWENSVEGIDQPFYQTGSNTIINAADEPNLYYGDSGDPQFPVNGKPAGAAYCTDTNVMPNGPIVGDPADARNGIGAGALQSVTQEAAVRFTMGWVDLDSVGTNNSAETFRESNLGFYNSDGSVQDLTIHSPFGLQSHWTLIVPGSVQYSNSTLDFTTIVYHIPSSAKGLPTYLQNIHVTGNTLGQNLFSPVPQLMPVENELEYRTVPKLLFMGYGLFLGDGDGNNQFGDVLGTGPLGWSPNVGG
jgi:hypothetical protein